MISVTVSPLFGSRLSVSQIRSNLARTSGSSAFL